jgi:hypothetical protein
VTLQATRRFCFAAASACLALVSAACLQPSLNALFEPEDLVFDERLLGAWACSATETWTFEKKQDKTDDRLVLSYFGLRITEANESADMMAALGRLGGNDFINFGPGSEPAGPGFARRHYIGVNTFGRIRIDTDRVVLDMLDSDWIEKAPNDVRRLGVKQGETFVLTAPTRDLQAFVLEYATDTDAVGERIILVKPGAAGGVCYSDK